MERHILREGTSCPIFFPCTLLQTVSSETTLTPLIACVSLARLSILTTDYLNLTVSFSFPVVSFRLHTCSTGLPRCTVIPLFTNHNMTAFQSTRGHQERTPNPCQQSFYYITRWSICITEFQRISCVLFSRTDSGFCIDHLIVWSKFNLLPNSQLIAFPNQSCLVSYSFCANLLHSSAM